MPRRSTPACTLAAPLLLAALTALLTTAAVHAQAPEPAIVSPSWNLEVSFSEPDVIPVPGPQGLQWYWYMTYQVINNSGEDRLFIPEIVIATDTGEIVEANQNISPLAFPMIQRRVGNALLESPAQVIGTIRQGEDYAKEGVIIWPQFAEPYSRFYLFFAGYSGESAVVDHPITGEPVHLQRTIMLSFDAPGNPPNPEVQLESVSLEDRIEVMR